MFPALLDLLIFLLQTLHQRTILFDKRIQLPLVLHTFLFVLLGHFEVLIIALLVHDVQLIDQILLLYYLISQLIQLFQFVSHFFLLFFHLVLVIQLLLQKALPVVLFLLLQLYFKRIDLVLAFFMICLVGLNIWRRFAILLGLCRLNLGVFVESEPICWLLLVLV